MYITATIVDRRGQRWDSKQNRFVNGPVESRLFYQIAGRHPDLNHNGVDDLIDIRSGKSRDRRRTGIPDDAAQLFAHLHAAEPERGGAPQRIDGKIAPSSQAAACGIISARAKSRAVA
jgi:hypothetical protein